MNNVIIVNQRVLARWRGQVDGTDALIVAHVERIQTSSNPRIAAKRIAGGFSWVDLEALLWDNPVVMVTYSGLRKRLQRLVKIGVLERKSDFENGRNRSYFRLHEEWHRWDSFWELHDGEEAARVYGWDLPKQRPSKGAVCNTGSPEGRSESPPRDAVQSPSRDQYSSVLTVGTPLTQGKQSSPVSPETRETGRATGGTEIVPEGQKAGGTVNRSTGSERQVPINKGSTFQKENAPPVLSDHTEPTTESSTAGDPNGGEEKKGGTPFALVSRFYERFAETYGFSPDWQTSSKARDLGIAKKMIVRVGEEKAEEALARYFDSEYWFTKDGRELPNLLRHIDELATAKQGGADAFWSQI